MFPWHITVDQHRYLTRSLVNICQGMMTEATEKSGQSTADQIGIDVDPHGAEFHVASRIWKVLRTGID